MGNGRHEVIEKAQSASCHDAVKKVVLSTEELISECRLVMDSRYEDTYDMAQFLCDNFLDAGYDYSQSNDEHFVTFCLTRWNRTSKSRKFCLTSQSKNKQAAIGSFFGNAFKLISHPGYKLFGGQMSLSGRFDKTALPFGMDGEGVGSRSKIAIGSSPRGIPDAWCPFDQKPSRYHLLRCYN